MSRASYQYGTSPRKYETDYNPRKRPLNAQKQNKSSNSNNQKNKNETKKRIQEQKAKKKQEKKNQRWQITAVLIGFVMLLSLSLREIAIMEMFDQKKDMESQLATIQKENGQIEKSIKEEESKLDWNDIQSIAKEQLGMQIKTSIPLDLEKTDNVETSTTYIKEDETNLLEKIVEYFLNKTK